MSEHQEQCLVFQWARYHTSIYPCLAFMYGTLNGVKLTIGQATKAKKGGNKAGVPDIVLPYPTGKYHGLYIELKVGKNKPSKEQKEYIKYLRSVGYCAEVAYGSKEAIIFIEDYVRNKL